MNNESKLPILSMLIAAKDEALGIIETKKAELVHLDRAIDAVRGDDGTQVSAPAPRPTPKHPMNVGDAIILAVEAGKKTPVDVFEYLKAELDVHTTIGSVRARLSPLKKEGKISHDGEGWVPIQSNIHGL